MASEMLIKAKESKMNDFISFLWCSDVSKRTDKIERTYLPFKDGIL